MSHVKNCFEVQLFLRKPRPAFNFSFEQIFDDLQKRLGQKVNFSVIHCPLFNAGPFSMVINLLYAAFAQRKGLRHITGELHFLNLLMPRKKVLLTIHDCGMVYRKQGLARWLVNLVYLRWPVRRATIITTVSNTTKQEVIRLSGASSADIRVIPVAVNAIFQPYPKAFASDKPVILHIGTAPNKNLNRLIEALAGIRCHLRIIGRLEAQHHEALAKHGISWSNGYNLSQSEMLREYQACDILAFVSTFEGFGMPIVEANCVERVVVTSNISSMPEVAGNAACLVDPFSVPTIRAGILKVIEEEHYRSALIENGRINKLRFDPDSIAGQYYEVYKELHATKK